MITNSRRNVPKLIKSSLSSPTNSSTKLEQQQQSAINKQQTIRLQNCFKATANNIETKTISSLSSDDHLLTSSALFINTTSQNQGSQSQGAKNNNNHVRIKKATTRAKIIKTPEFNLNSSSSLAKPSKMFSPSLLLPSSSPKTIIIPLCRVKTGLIYNNKQQEELLQLKKTTSFVDHNDNDNNHNDFDNHHNYNQRNIGEVNNNPNAQKHNSPDYTSDNCFDDDDDDDDNDCYECDDCNVIEEDEDYSNHDNNQADSNLTMEDNVVKDNVNDDEKEEDEDVDVNNDDDYNDDDVTVDGDVDDGCNLFQITDTKNPLKKQKTLIVLSAKKQQQLPIKQSIPVEHPVQATSIQTSWIKPNPNFQNLVINNQVTPVFIHPNHNYHHGEHYQISVNPEDIIEDDDDDDDDNDGDDDDDDDDDDDQNENDDYVNVFKIHKNHNQYNQQHKHQHHNQQQVVVVPSRKYRTLFLKCTIPGCKDMFKTRALLHKHLFDAHDKVLPNQCVVIDCNQSFNQKYNFDDSFNYIFI